MWEILIINSHEFFFFLLIKLEIAACNVSLNLQIMIYLDLHST